MSRVILDDDVADMLEPVCPPQDFHPNISHYDLLPIEWNLPILSLLIFNDSFDYGSHIRHNLTGVRVNDTCKQCLVLRGQPLDGPAPQRLSSGIASSCRNRL